MRNHVYVITLLPLGKEIMKHLMCPKRSLATMSDQTVEGVSDGVGVECDGGCVCCSLTQLTDL